MSTDVAQKLKSLKTQRKKRAERVGLLNDEMARLKADISSEHRTIAELDEEIAKLTDRSKELVITEHALLRYLERVKGVDLDDLREEIASDKLKARVSQFGGNGWFRVDGYRFRLKNHSIITVAP